MEIRSIITSLPDGSRPYAFGSWASNSSGNDADILIVYDAAKCPPDRAYERHAQFLHLLKSHLPLPVDVTLLTSSEEAQVGFISREGCIDLEDALNRNCEQDAGGNALTRAPQL